MQWQTLLPSAGKKQNVFLKVPKYQFERNICCVCKVMAGSQDEMCLFMQLLSLEQEFEGGRQ